MKKYRPGMHLPNDLGIDLRFIWEEFVPDYDSPNPSWLMP